MYHLRLDDIRDPYTYGSYKGWDSVAWCENYEQFVIVIKELWMPGHISFDHDLGGFETGIVKKNIDKIGNRDIKYEVLEFPLLTWYDCAKWLVEYCIVNEIPLPEYSIHSTNPVWAENIKGLFEDYKRFYDDVKTHLDIVKQVHTK